MLPSEPGRHSNGEANKLSPADRPVHDWYRFVLSFPPHLVREYIARLRITSQERLLDPFCGTGTTLVESRKLGVPSVGVESNPMAHFASRVKVDWSPDPDGLLQHARAVAEEAVTRLGQDDIEDEPFFQVHPNGHHHLRTLQRDSLHLLLTGSISPLPLHKALVLLDCLADHWDARYDAHERLALAKTLVFRSSNLQFGPEVGVGPEKLDAPVVAPWLASVQVMAHDLHVVRDRGTVPPVLLGDARDLLAPNVSSALQPESVDAVITSPPYPNEKDYTRTTRLESVLLGFISNKAGLRSLKEGFLRSNTRGVYKRDDDDLLALGYPEIQRIAGDIEARRIALGKTSGFERLYARVTKLYFGGMVRHLAGLRTILRPGARLAYVVGDQASYLQVMIRTGQLLAQIAESLGYELVSIDLFRTRLATATGEQLREEVVVLRWPGHGRVCLTGHRVAASDSLSSSSKSIALRGRRGGAPRASTMDYARARRLARGQRRVSPSEGGCVPIK